jgi:hypothetical protein
MQDESNNPNSGSTFSSERLASIDFQIMSGDWFDFMRLNYKLEIKSK